jgi:hypothetical protein
MAKKEQVNKTQAVKVYLKANPKAKNQAVVDALAKKVMVSPTYALDGLAEKSTIVVASRCAVSSPPWSPPTGKRAV